MKAFISWSGEPSRSVALILRQWLPRIVQHVEPWMSDEEITSGTRWNDGIAVALEETDFGIVCVTAANQHQPWLIFEAGALAKRLKTARVVPLFIDLEAAEVTGPLVAFQGRRIDRDGLRKLVHDVGLTREPPLTPSEMDPLFDIVWPTLESELEHAKQAAPPVETPRRSNESMLAEVLEGVRRVERTYEQLFDRLAADVRLPLIRARAALKSFRTILAEQSEEPSGELFRRDVQFNLLRLLDIAARLEHELALIETKNGRMLVQGD